MATEWQIRELLENYVDTMATYSVSDLDELIENTISNYESKDDLHNIEEIKIGMHLYLSRINRVCIKYKSKNIDLYQRFKDLTEKIGDKEKFYNEDNNRDKLSLINDYEELKDLTELIGLAVGSEDSVSRIIDMRLE